MELLFFEKSMLLSSPLTLPRVISRRYFTTLACWYVRLTFVRPAACCCLYSILCIQYLLYIFILLCTKVKNKCIHNILLHACCRKCGKSRTEISGDCVHSWRIIQLEFGKSVRWKNTCQLYRFDCYYI